MEKIYTKDILEEDQEIRKKINGFLNKQDLRIENFIDPKIQKPKGVIYNARKAAAESLRIRRLCKTQRCNRSKIKEIKEAT